MAPKGLATRRTACFDHATGTTSRHETRAASSPSASRASLLHYRRVLPGFSVTLLVTLTTLPPASSIVLAIVTVILR